MKICIFVLYLTCVHISSEFELTILHTNDIHARIEQTNKNSGTCAKELAAKLNCFGGAARIRSMVIQIRAQLPNVLLLDAGDGFQGTLWYYQFGGLVTAIFMNLIGYDVMSVGNHEFDRGIDGFLPFLKKVTFPVLSSNMNLNRTAALKGFIRPSVVLELGGQKVGVVGYTTPSTKFISKSETVTFIEELAAIQSEVDKLTSQGINKIIAVGHSGYTRDMELAYQLRDVDIVVGGHTHTFLYNGTAPSNEVPQGVYPTLVDNLHSGTKVLVIQDYAFGKYLGQLQVKFDDYGQVTSWAGNPILLDSSVPQDEETLQLIEMYLPEIESLRNTTIGFSNVDLIADKIQCRSAECNIGNFVADAMLNAAIFAPRNDSWNDVSMAVVNAGSFRASIQTGPITVETALSVEPFRNTLDIIVVTGQTIVDMFEFVASKWTTDASNAFEGFLQVTGIQVTFNFSRPLGSRVVEVKVTCTKCKVPRLEPLQRHAEYSLLTTSFIYNGGDGFTMFPDKIIRKSLLGKIDTDALLDYVKTHQPIRTGIQGRIRQVQDMETITITKLCETNVAGSRKSNMYTPILLFLIIFCSS